jgi:hypothetical protein
MTDTNLSDLLYSTGLTDWHFDSYDGPRNHVLGMPLFDPRACLLEALEGDERLIAELSFPWSESPSRSVH